MCVVRWRCLAFALGFAFGFAAQRCTQADARRAQEHDATRALTVCAQSYHDHMLTMHVGGDDVAAGWREVEMAARRRAR